MHARRLILAPVVALAAVALVGAIIDSGQRARLADRIEVTAGVTATDPGLDAEARRVRDAIASARQCSPLGGGCSTEVVAARLRRTAGDVGRWRYEHRFRAVRETLRIQLLLEADVLDQRAANEVDGHTTFRERARLDELEERRDDAALASARAQREAHLVDRATYDALVEDLT